MYCFLKLHKLWRCPSVCSSDESLTSREKNKFEPKKGTRDTNWNEKDLALISKTSSLSNKSQIPPIKVGCLGKLKF